MAQTDLPAQAVKLASLHVPHKPLVLTNVWDAGSAKVAAAHPSCAALATASYAVAGCAGIQDDDLTMEENLAAVERIAAVAKEFGKPLTVDVQSGYGDRLEETVRKLLDIGVVGCNLEDMDGATGKMYPVEEAVQRVERTLAVAKEFGVPQFVVNARTDILGAGGTVKEAIERGQAYLNAGATTFFIWRTPRSGGATRGEIVEVVQALKGRVSVALGLVEDSLTVADLAKIGVARVSCGPRLWSKAMQAVEQDMNSIFDSAGKED